MKFKQDDQVIGHVSTYSTFKGKICGISTVEMPVIGHMYIVECTDGTFPSLAYSFTHISIPESMLELQI